MADDRNLLLGVDGGGTRCRARLALSSGEVIGEGEAGPANLRLGFAAAFAAVLEAAGHCLAAARLSKEALTRTTACLALAGASEPAERAAASRYPLPFRRTIITTDAEAACIGAHGGDDGGIVVVGTGSIGWAIVDGDRHRVGGWGLAVSDEGSGAWLGLETARRVLWAYDKRIRWTPLLVEVSEKFGRDPYALGCWAASAKPRDFGRLAPLVFAHARSDDPAACELAGLAAGHVDALAARLVDAGAGRIALAGGLAAAIEPYLAAQTRRRLVAPKGDALAGALRLAAGEPATRAAAE